VVGNKNEPWENFYRGVESLVKRFGLEKQSGNGARIKADDVEALRVQLAGLPNVNYGNFKKTDPSGADGLIRNHFFLSESPPDMTMRSTSVAHYPYPDPSDDYLIDTLKVRYAANDVAGYGKRLRELRKDFALCSVGRAKELHRRLTGRLSGDRVSELFYDHLSREGRAILLRVLKGRG
jgi:hypothetical protein